MQAHTHVYTPRANVLMREVGDESVLLDLDSGTYHTLNGVATTIWAGLADGKSLQQLAETIVALFEVDREQASRDLEAFIAGLGERGLLAPQYGAG